MPRNSISVSDPVDIPSGVSVDQKGYVYYNMTDIRRTSADGNKKYCDHKKVLIGKILNPEDKDSWKIDRRMYPNANYTRIFKPDVVQVGSDTMTLPPKKFESLSVGGCIMCREIALKSGLTDDLVAVFGEEDTKLILDLAQYMLCTESAKFQAFPHYGKSHGLLSGCIRSDSYISRFLRRNITISKVELFKSYWALRNTDDGKLYYCYDSTNTNSQAEGCFLVQKGYAKDDSTLNQVNTDYVVRQRDGMPITFSEFPGSITDIKEAKDMIQFLQGIFEAAKAKNTTEPQSLINLLITLVCDRAYISEDNVADLDNAGIGFLLMLRKNLGIVTTLLDKYGGSVRSSKNYLDDVEKYAITIQHPLYEGDTKNRYFHIIYDPAMEKVHGRELYHRIAGQEKLIRQQIARKTRLTSEQIRNYSRWFSMVVDEVGTLTVKKKGKGKGTKEVPSYVIVSAERNHKLIDKDVAKCGFTILVTSEEMTAAEAIEAYGKRDCVEKVFRALKSSLGMETIGVYSDDAIHGKALIWFVASVIYAIIHNRTSDLRKANKKLYTVPSIIDQLEEIVADKDLRSGKYRRRHLPTRTQENIFKALEMKISDIDNYISKL